MNRGIQYRKYLYVTSGLPYDYIMYKPVNSNRERKTGRESAYRLNSGISYMMIYTGIIERVTLILSAVFYLYLLGLEYGRYTRFFMIKTLPRAGFHLWVLYRSDFWCVSDDNVFDKIYEYYS